MIVLRKAIVHGYTDKNGRHVSDYDRPKVPVLGAAATPGEARGMWLDAWAKDVQRYGPIRLPKEVGGLRVELGRNFLSHVTDGERFPQHREKFAGFLAPTLRRPSGIRFDPTRGKRNLSIVAHYASLRDQTGHPEFNAAVTISRDGSGAWVVTAFNRTDENWWRSYRTWPVLYSRKKRDAT